MKELEQFGAYVLPTGEIAVFFSANNEFTGDCSYPGAETGEFDTSMTDPESKGMTGLIFCTTQAEAFGLCAIHHGDWTGRYAIDSDGNARRVLYTGGVRVDLWDADFNLVASGEVELTATHPALYTSLPGGQRLHFKACTRVADEISFHIDGAVPYNDIAGLLDGIDL